MKIIQIVLMVLAVFVLLLKKGNDEYMIYLKVGAVVVFMVSMMRLSTKTPSKNQNKEDKDV
ncbi:hypothetical protein FFWV33_10445 [Flavobacterium faecale]|uniref:Uncharacterized protein n=1 Tax=Flavobacterium faecale TaxID=1355330 RepID=A0A2S1LDR7_9FLAO|nr:hypothetical protein [Flavobacterium faecale]AWG21912.1 hypothetical protein FFWV33_10445 [Flavobacterium faecale]